MRIPGATKLGLSFSLFLFTNAIGFFETALSAVSLSRSKSEASAACPMGFRMSSSFGVPLEIMMGMWKSLAIVVSLRRLDKSLILAGPSRVSRGFVSISSAASEFEASSASARSKNLLRKSIEGKFKRSTRRSFAACLETFLESHITEIISNSRLSFLRVCNSSFGLLGFRSTRVAMSRLTSLQVFRVCWISCPVQFGGRVMAIWW